MPDLSRLANCWVKVASSWSLGLRFWDMAARKAGGNRARQSVLRPAEPFSGGGDGAAFGGIHRDREESQALDLNQRRRAVGDFEDALDDFARAAARFVRKLWHKARLWFLLNKEFSQKLRYSKRQFGEAAGRSQGFESGSRETRALAGILRILLARLHGRRANWQERRTITTNTSKKHNK